MVSTLGAKENNTTTVTEPEPVKVPAGVPVSNVSLEDLQSILEEHDFSINSNSNFLNNTTSLQLNEILSTFGHSNHFNMDAYLEKLDVFSSLITIASNFQALGTADMFVLTAFVSSDELHALESYL